MVPQQVNRWCKHNGWTEPVLKEGKYYAFAPNAVVPQPIPIWWNITDAYKRLELFYIFVLSSLLVLVLCLFLWHWRGIWSVYISQVENQKFLACHYCPLTTGILVEIKDSSQGLFEVESLILSKPAKLVVTKYSGSKKVTKLVSQNDVQGRVLYLFEPEESKVIQKCN